MSTKLAELVVLSLAVATVSMTITKSMAFEWLRWWLEAKGYKWVQVGTEERKVPRLEGKYDVLFRSLYELSICPYCLSHWLSFLVVGIYRPRVLNSGVLVLDLVVEAFAVTAIATFWAAIIFRAFYIKEK